MNKNILLLIGTIFTLHFGNAQSITIDGKFNDWSGISIYTDPTGDGNGIDLRGFSVTNDDENLYIRLITNTTFNLGDSNSLYLNIDVDNDSSTGYHVNKIGAELGWRFGSRYGFHYHNGLTDTIFANELKMVNLPTYKKDTFEIAINRAALTGLTSVNSDTIKLCFSNGVSGGDLMPNFGSTRYYVFNNTIHSDFAPIELNKCNAAYIRVMTYNTAFDGLIDTARQGNYKRILQAINPDIIVFNECNATSYQQAKSDLDTWLPITGGWTCYKVDPANIICSRFPIKYAKNISFRKATVTYIDLPSTYQTDLLFIGTHLMFYNDGDSTRQEEADLLAGYLRDMKAGLTAYPIPANTPFIIAGDFNLVNSYSPLNTLLTGNILNTATYGVSSLPDWNNAPLSSIDAKLGDRNMTYTWRARDLHGKWWPGKLDYILHSNTNLKVKKSFVLQSEIMSNSRLTQYGLLTNDCVYASDHLPVVADFEIPMTNLITQNVHWNGSVNTAWENPANWDCSMVPDENSNVTIPSVAPNFPHVNYNTEVRSIHSLSQSSVTVQPGVQLKLNGQ